MPTVEQVRIILERTFGFPVLESDAQIVFDRLVDLARKEAVEHSVQRMCANCGANNWVTIFNPGTHQYCGSCGAHR